MDIDVSQCHLLKGLFFSTSCAFDIFVEDELTIYALVYVWDFSPIPLVYVDISFQYHTVLFTVTL